MVVRVGGDGTVQHTASEAVGHDRTDHVPRRPSRWKRPPGAGDRFWATGWQVQAAGDEGIVLRLYVDSWHPQGDAAAAAQEALKRYRGCPPPRVTV